MRDHRIFAAICGLVFPAVMTLGQTTTPATHTSTTSLPPVGLASTETIEVNVVNTAGPTDAALASCTGSVAFYSMTGTMIGSATSFTVGSGQIFPVKLPFASAQATSFRTLVRAVISLTTTSPTAAAGAPIAIQGPCTLAYSLETYDSGTGVT